MLVLSRRSAYFVIIAHKMKPGFDAQPHVWEQERMIRVVAPGFLYCGYSLGILAPPFARFRSRSSAGNRF
jgi:hypothetical protein